MKTSFSLFVKSMLTAMLIAIFIFTFRDYGVAANDAIYYENGVDGYRICYPPSCQLDNSLKGTVTRLRSNDGKCVISIFAQSLQGISADGYLQYSNRNILQQKYGVKLLYTNQKAVNKIKAYRLMWERPKIYNVPNDLNLYREINLIYNDFIYTFDMKTDQSSYSIYGKAMDQIVYSFSRIKPYESAYINPAAPQVNDIQLQGKTMKITIPKNKMMWGIFHPIFHPDIFQPNKLDEFKAYESSLGHKFDFIMTYTEFYKPFPTQLVKNTYDDNRIMMVTWAPYWQPGNDSVILPAIINGDYDFYIKEWARQVKNIQEPVFVRIANEMNGDWVPWCSWFYSKDPDLYIEAWQRIYKLFKEEQADNAIFVWNPHDRSFPNFKWNQSELYYPGAQYVDWVGLTCYNNGTGYAGETWRYFNDMYWPVYYDYLGRYPGKPFMITEFSASETGGNKVAWIYDMFKSISNYTNIRIAVWYDQTDGKRLYRIDSTPASKEAFKTGLTGTYFLNNAIERITSDTKDDKETNNKNM